MNSVFIHLDTLIVSQILRQFARRYFSYHSKMFFSVQDNFPIERWENLVLFFLKIKFEWNFKKVPNDFSINYSGINFYSWKESPESLLIQEHWRAFTWNVNIFQSSSFIVITKCFMLYRRSRELFYKKAFCVFSSSFATYFATVVINDWKTNFDIAIVLEITVFPYSVRFLIFHIFNTRWISITS